MRQFYTLLSFIFFIILMTGCKSAAKLYNKGNYDEAVEVAVKKLQKKPNDAETKSLIISAYDYAVNDHESRIKQYGENSNELKWEWIYSEYVSLQHLYEAIRRSPEATEIIRPIDYSSYVNTYADKAAQTRFDRGIHWMERNDKLSYRNAYNEFSIALNYRPGDLDIVDKRDEAYEYAVTNVIVMSGESNRYRFSSFVENDWRNIENDMLRQLQFNSGNKFVRFLSPAEAAGRNIQPDQFIDVRFTTFDIGRTRDEKTVREVSKDVVVKETVYRPDSIVKEYKKVYAKITTTRRTMLSGGNMQVFVRDAFSKRLWTDNIHGDYNWYTEFSTYTGDERALSDSDKVLVNCRPEFPPSDSEIMRSIINQINSNMLYKVRNYYSRL